MLRRLKRYFGGFVPSREFRRSRKSKLVELEQEIKFPKTFEPAYVTPAEMAKIRASFMEPSVVVTPRSEFGGSSNNTVSSERSHERPPEIEININEDLLNVNRERPVRFASTPDRSIVPPITVDGSRENEISAVVEEEESFSFEGFEQPVVEDSGEEIFSFEGFEPPANEAVEPSSLRAQEILSSPVTFSSFTFSFLEDWNYSPNVSLCASNFNHDSINLSVEQSPESRAVVETFDIEEENLERSVGCCCSS